MLVWWNHLRQPISVEALVKALVTRVSWNVRNSKCSEKDFRKWKCVLPLFVFREVPLRERDASDSEGDLAKWFQREFPWNDCFNGFLQSGRFYSFVFGSSRDANHFQDTVLCSLRSVLDILSRTFCLGPSVKDLLSRNFCLGPSV